LKARQLGLRALVCALAVSALVQGQTSDTPPSSALLSAADPTDCGFITLQSVTNLTFKQRTCYLEKKILSPRFALAAAVSSAFGQFRNSPYVLHQNFQDFPYRLAVYYARRSTRNTAELMAGYLHKEDPRFRPSNSQSFWRRTDSAFLNVLTSPDADGHLRIAYAPIAGALSSAFVGSIMYRHQETLEQTLGHAAGIYAYYFVRYFCKEFKPEMKAYARRILHSDK
jgi:hypothetical protein